MSSQEMVCGANKYTFDRQVLSNFSLVLHFTSKCFYFYHVEPENEVSHSGKSDTAHPQIALRQFKTSSSLLLMSAGICLDRSVKT